MDKSEYFIFRYFILPTSDQISIYHEQEDKKEDIILKNFKLVKDLKKIDFIHRGDRFLIFANQVYKDDLYYFQIAKEHRMKEYKEGADKVIEEDVNRLEVVNIVCQCSTQLIMIQKDTTAFSDVSAPINAFENYLTKVVKPFDYIVSIDEKTSEKKFWDYVENAKGVYSLELKFNSLNMNLGGSEVRETLKQLKGDFNNDEVDIKLKNSDGNLIVNKNVAGKFIDYITKLGGKYRLVYLAQNGTKKAIDSLSNIIKLRFLKNIEDEDPEKINEILKHISTKNDVEENT